MGWSNAAVQDHYVVPNNRVLERGGPRGLLGNDRPPSAATEVVLVTGPASGQLQLNPDGSFTYTPDTAFVGDVTFTYRLEDGADSSNVVTVVVSERSRASSDAATQVERDSSVSARLRSDVGLQDLVAKPIGEILGLLLAADRRDVPAGSDLDVVDAATVSEFDGSGTTSRGGRFDAVITCRVVAELPNDVLHVRGRRAIVVNHELQYMTVEGLVRREDIGIDNVVSSSALGDARITIDGLGVIDDKQRPGWLARILAWTLPF